MGRRRSGACVCIPYRCGIAAFGQKGYLCGKHHGMMKITSAGFAFSSGRISQIPDDGLPEFAFIGRSNVGKSSLINMLTDNGSLAKVSATPGKTKLINHFLINGQWYLVDLPGYGYAKASKSDRREFGKLITDYVTKAKKMWFLFVLVDSRHAPCRSYEAIRTLIPIGRDWPRERGGAGTVRRRVSPSATSSPPGRRMPISASTKRGCWRSGRSCRPFSVPRR